MRRGLKIAESLLIFARNSILSRFNVNEICVCVCGCTFDRQSRSKCGTFSKELLLLFHILLSCPNRLESNHLNDLPFNYIRDTGEVIRENNRSTTDFKIERGKTIA